MTQAYQVQKPTPQPDADCPDPTAPHTKYRVDAAAAQEASTLYTADAASVDPRYQLLHGAQGKYAEAKAAQKDAYEELAQQLDRIKDSLYCSVKEADRNRLAKCWQDLLGETKSVEQNLDCSEVDGLTCDQLPQEIDRLRALASQAGACATRADNAFDRLAGLPGTLGPRIKDLGTQATALEQEVCGPRNDPRRSFVKYLRLRHEFDLLKDDWVDPARYGCKLKRYFKVLLHRHVITICLKVAVARYDKSQAFEDEAKAAKKDNLIDLVLECATPKPGSGGPAAAPAEPSEPEDEESASEGYASTQPAKPESI
ncbi:MAG: hypothetical protein AUI14_18260 [Actinobacteria bacterium 13_2_20CM_2_71_6]|nr:MAG: hypothetical protein AUI14_18260 [Actinobacteria bacterium 13_2_20CM_2_71_6]